MQLRGESQIINVQETTSHVLVRVNQSTMKKLLHRVLHDGGGLRYVPLLLLFAVPSVSTEITCAVCHVCL